MFRRVYIADVSAVINTGLADDSLSDADIATAVDVTTGVNTDGRVVVAFGIAKERTNTAGRVLAASGIAKERTITVGRVVPAFGVV